MNEDGICIHVAPNLVNNGVSVNHALSLPFGSLTVSIAKMTAILPHCACAVAISVRAAVGFPKERVV